jgi:UDP-glucuronate 4-epimerase
MILITGAAGFIGSHVAHALLARGEAVLGIDNLNDHYDVSLKQARLSQLESQTQFAFRKIDISDRDGILGLANEFPAIDRIVHLAAQPGVRYSLINPYAYVQSNVMGQVVMLELARSLKKLKHPFMAAIQTCLSRWTMTSPNLTPLTRPPNVRMN